MIERDAEAPFLTKCRLLNRPELGGNDMRAAAEAGQMANTSRLAVLRHFLMGNRVGECAVVAYSVELRISAVPNVYQCVLGTICWLGVGNAVYHVKRTLLFGERLF